MEYIIIILIVVCIILQIISLTRNNNDTNERINKMELVLTKEIGEFKHDFSKEMNLSFNDLNDRIEYKLNNIDSKVNERLDESFSKTNKTFTEVMNRLSRIDEAQKKIDHLSTNIVSLESILTDKKSRGIFGETNLYHILSSIFGEKNDKIYQTQYTLSNSTIVDAIVFGPQPLGTICIDSKFPLENYRRLVEENISKSEIASRSKDFENDVKKHIDAIASKYIIDGETNNQAIMFIPAEAIFAYINAYHTNLIRYATNKRVWVTSPTTLMSLLTIIQTVLKGMERDKYANIIHDELNKLSVEFTRYKDRWDKLSKSIKTVSKEVDDINITTNKITNKFNNINNVKIDTKDKSN